MKKYVFVIALTIFSLLFINNVSAADPWLCKDSSKDYCLGLKDDFRYQISEYDNFVKNDNDYLKLSGWAFKYNEDTTDPQYTIDVVTNDSNKILITSASSNGTGNVDTIRINRKGLRLTNLNPKEMDAVLPTSVSSKRYENVGFDIEINLNKLYEDIYKVLNAEAKEGVVLRLNFCKTQKTCNKSTADGFAYISIYNYQDRARQHYPDTTGFPRVFNGSEVAGLGMTTAEIKKINFKSNITLKFSLIPPRLRIGSQYAPILKYKDSFTKVEGTEASNTLRFISMYDSKQEEYQYSVVGYHCTNSHLNITTSKVCNYQVFYTNDSGCASLPISGFSHGIPRCTGMFGSSNVIPSWSLGTWSISHGDFDLAAVINVKYDYPIKIDEIKVPTQDFKSGITLKFKANLDYNYFKDTLNKAIFDKKSFTYVVDYCGNKNEVSFPGSNIGILGRDPKEMEINFTKGCSSGSDFVNIKIYEKNTHILRPNAGLDLVTLGYYQKKTNKNISCKTCDKLGYDYYSEDPVLTIKSRDKAASTEYETKVVFYPNDSTEAAAIPVSTQPSGYPTKHENLTRYTAWSAWGSTPYITGTPSYRFAESRVVHKYKKLITTSKTVNDSRCPAATCSVCRTCIRYKCCMIAFGDCSEWMYYYPKCGNAGFPVSGTYKCCTNQQNASACGYTTCTISESYWSDYTGETTTPPTGTYVYAPEYPKTQYRYRDQQWKWSTIRSWVKEAPVEDVKKDVFYPNNSTEAAATYVSTEPSGYPTKHTDLTRHTDWSAWGTTSYVTGTPSYRFAESRLIHKYRSWTTCYTNKKDSSCGALTCTAAGCGTFYSTINCTTQCISTESLFSKYIPTSRTGNFNYCSVSNCKTATCNVPWEFVVNFLNSCTKANKTCTDGSICGWKSCDVPYSCWSGYTGETTTPPTGTYEYAPGYPKTQYRYRDQQWKWSTINISNPGIVGLDIYYEKVGIKLSPSPMPFNYIGSSFQYPIKLKHTISKKYFEYYNVTPSITNYSNITKSSFSFYTKLNEDPYKANYVLVKDISKNTSDGDNYVYDLAYDLANNIRINYDSTILLDNNVYEQKGPYKNIAINANTLLGKYDFHLSSSSIGVNKYKLTNTCSYKLNIPKKDDKCLDEDHYEYCLAPEYDKDGNLSSEYFKCCVCDSDIGKDPSLNVCTSTTTFATDPSCYCQHHPNYGGCKPSLPYVYRSISLNNPFPDRVAGPNWKNRTLVQPIEKYITNTSSNPKCSIKLTGSQINAMKKNITSTQYASTVVDDKFISTWRLEDCIK